MLSWVVFFRCVCGCRVVCDCSLLRTITAALLVFLGHGRLLFCVSLGLRIRMLFQCNYLDGCAFRSIIDVSFVV